MTFDTVLPGRLIQQIAEAPFATGPRAGEGYAKVRTRGKFQNGYRAGIAFALAWALTGLREGTDPGWGSGCGVAGKCPHPTLPRNRGRESLRKLGSERPHPPLPRERGRESRERGRETLRKRGEPEFRALQGADCSDLDDVERRSMDLSLHLSLGRGQHR